MIIVAKTLFILQNLPETRLTLIVSFVVSALQAVFLDRKFSFKESYTAGMTLECVLLCFIRNGVTKENLTGAQFGVL